jgi:hypothetical protein
VLKEVLMTESRRSGIMRGVLTGNVWMRKAASRYEVDRDRQEMFFSLKIDALNDEPRLRNS